MMQRRSFLRSLSAASLGGFAVRGFSNPLLAPLLDGPADGRALVIVQLYGGNDGLNTVIPLDQYGVLAQVRSNILIDEASVLQLAGLNATGLHPSMTGLRDLWDMQRLAIVQGVGYPNPDYSHFRSTDIWETGANSDQLLDSGWTGRYLNYEYPNYPVGYPNDTMPDPLAIRIGGPVTIGLQSHGVSMGASIYSTQDSLDLTGNLFNDPVTADCKGSKLDVVRTVQRQTDLYGDVIQAAALPGCNLSTMYPAEGEPGARLARALKIVAQLICGGLKTRIYWVSMSGFDTHSDQAVAGDTSNGYHADLLKGLSDSIRAFQDDLHLLGIEDRVLGMTFSEFGRRIKSNSSHGTDHGSAAPMFLFGSKVIPGMLGANPDIPANTNSGTNLAMQYDFRSVYGSVLKDWFCLSQTDVDGILLDTYQTLALVDPNGCLNTSVHEANQGAGVSLLDVYPDPFVDRTTVRFNSDGGHVIITVSDEQGRAVRQLVNRMLPLGEHTVAADLEELTPGVYYCRLQNGTRQQVKSMLKVR